MILNLGPQHPATHGTLRLVVRLDGERVVAADPVIGYMHRGYEKLTEFRTYPQITTLINRIDWLSSFANEVPFIDAAEHLMGIEAPDRAQYIRSILTELSRIATFVLFLGEMGLQVGALTPAFYGFRDREHVLNLIESATGGRFHPNFNRIGGLKDDLPWGWVNETRTAMKTIFDALRHVRGPARRQRDLRGPHALDRHHPGRARRGLRRVGLEPAGLRASTGTSVATASRTSCTRTSTSRSGRTPTATRSPATGCGSRRRASPRAWCSRCSTSCRPVRSWPRSRASSRCPRARPGSRPRTRSAQMGYYVVSKGATGPFRVKIRSASFSNVSILPWLLQGVFVPDVITILASLYFILGDIDR